MKKSLSDALQERGYDTLTPVQEAVGKPELIGADLLVSAQTGSGKTLGFGLAIAPTLLGEAETFEPAALPLALVIAPTRELAMQVKRELSWLYAKAGAHLASCVGGMDMRDERRALARGAHIVVATPGRLRDHLMRGSIDLSQLRAVVLDEADEMLDLGFREDLEFILGESPESRQTLLFSATVPQSIASLARQYQRDAIRIDTKSDTTQHADIEYQALNVSERDVDNAIINVLRFFEAPNAIVFCNTRATVNRMTTRLSNRGFSVVALSGELSQNERTHALQAMRDGRARVCVATDVAARGIDLPNLDLVVHAELPGSHETLLHRSGRTGRAGRKGVSTLIVPPKARKKAERILKFAKLRAAWQPAPSADAVRARDTERMLGDSVWQDAVTESETETVERLIEQFSPTQLAAAYLRLYHTHNSVPEELAGADAPPKPREPFGPSVWFAISVGRNQDAEPRRLLPMLCKAGEIDKTAIGAIRVQQDESFAEIKAATVPAFLAAIGDNLTLEPGAVLRQLDAPPDLGNTGRGGPPPKRRAPSTPPVEWNDDPAPRARKPKPGPKPGPKPAAKSFAKPGDRPNPKPAAAPSATGNSATTPRPAPTSEQEPGARKPRHKPETTRADDGAVVARRKPNTGGGATDRKRRGDDGPKGPPPPKGKSNSKKNKARAQAKAKARTDAKRGKPGSAGGAARPTRARGSHQT